MNHFQSDTNIYVTTSHDWFSLVAGNRFVEETRIQEMQESLKKGNWLPLFPIVVGQDGRVYDGQHRLLAAKRLGVPIFYIIGEMTVLEVARVNATVKIWTLDNYLNFWCVQGRDEYLDLAQFLSEWPSVKIIHVLRIKRRYWGNQTTEFRSGRFEFYTKELVRRTAKIAAFIEGQRGIEFAWQTHFIVALGQVISHPEFDEERFLANLQRVANLDRMPAIRDYQLQFERIYNLGRSTNRTKLVN